MKNQNMESAMISETQSLATVSVHMNGEQSGSKDILLVPQFNWVISYFRACDRWS